MAGLGWFLMHHPPIWPHHLNLKYMFNGCWVVGDVKTHLLSCDSQRMWELFSPSIFIAAKRRRLKSRARKHQRSQPGHVDGWCFEWSRVYHHNTLKDPRQWKGRFSNRLNLSVDPNVWSKRRFKICHYKLRHGIFTFQRHSKSLSLWPLMIRWL